MANSFTDIMDKLLGFGFSATQAKSMMDQLGATGDTAQASGATIGQKAYEDMQFQPFSVTSSMGGVAAQGGDPILDAEGNVVIDPTTGLPKTSGFGGLDFTLSEEQDFLRQGLETGATGLLGRAGARDGTTYDPLSKEALTGASTQLAGVSGIDPSILAQRTAMGGLFGSQLGQLGAPTGLEGLTQASLSGGQQRIQGAAPSSELLGLSNLFGGNISSMLTQQPSQQIGALGSRALSLGTTGLGGGAPSDIESLRQQYGDIAGQAASGLLQSRGGREQQVYDRIRAAQSPEEERQRLSLENRLASQGRLGVSTAQYGGTPEQLAMAKAQGESQNQAMLMAMQQAGTEEQQGLQRALSLSGQAGQLAGVSSQLQSADQQRAAQLAQLGLSAEQIGSGLSSEGLGRAATSAGLSSQLRQASSGLESEALQRGMGLGQLGMGGTQAGAGLDAQRLQQLLGLQQSDIGAAGSQQQLQQGRLGLASGMFGLGQQSSAMPSQLQAADIANLQALLQSSYAPEAQLLNQVQGATNIASIADLGQRQGATERSESEMAGVQANLEAELAKAGLLGSVMNSAGQVIGGGMGGGGLFSSIVEGGGDIWDWIKQNT